MKKRVFIPLILLVVMLLTVLVQAAPRILSINPSISFEGTTAECSVSVVADKMTDSIMATLILWDGSKVVDSWTASGTGYLLFSDSAQVTKGKTYKLTVDVVIKGIAKPRVSVEGTCNQ